MLFIKKVIAILLFDYDRLCFWWYFKKPSPQKKSFLFPDLNIDRTVFSES